MNNYRIIATLLAPLAIQKMRQTNSSETLTYLPGSSLRGALAAKYIREGGSPEDDDFKTLFINQPVCFPNLLPADKEGNVISQTLPLTGVSCKRFPGFKHNELHGVCDTLAKKLIDRNSPKYFCELQCQTCGEDMKAISGYWNGDIVKPIKFDPIIFYQRHTGIDRVTGTAAENIFYITQAMADYRLANNAGETENTYECRQVLSGGLLMDEHQYAILAPLAKGHLFAGSDRTRGMGELSIIIEPETDRHPNIDQWDQSFKSCIKDISKDALDPGLLSGVYFSVTMESHAILVDKFLRSNADLDLGFPGIEAVLKVTKSQIIRGWSDAWGIAKPDDMGIMMGSVYLFRYNGDNLEGLKQFLSRLTTNGIGLRREEGFGRILVCDSFHTSKEVI